MRDRRSLSAQGLALALGLACGFGAYTAQLPLPWLLGPMIGTTIAAILHAPIRGPDRLRPFVIPVIGVLLGSGMTMDVLRNALGWWTTLVILIPYLAVAAMASYQFYRRIGRYDPVTAFFSAMPGGLNDMLIMGGAAGGQEKRIALAHASRILVVITFVVLFYGFVLGVTSSDAARSWVPVSALTATDWAVLAACAIIGGPMGKLIRAPAPQILGPLLLSGAAHITGLVAVPPPTLAIVIAQIVVGTVIGCRFLGSSARDVGRDLVLGAGSSMLMIGVAVLFAMVVTGLTGTSLSQTFLAFSPGGLTEMSLIALAMRQDVTYVSVMHIFRLTIVILAAVPIFNLIRNR